jgi:translation elongation factor EF-Ts
MASKLAMHVAAMKPAFLKESDIPEKIKQDILDGENGKKALKKYIKRDVLWEQELATAEKSQTVGRFFSSESKALKTKINMKNWALFMIE